MGRARRWWWVGGSVAVVVLLALGLVLAVGRLDDFSGHCVGGVRVDEGLADEVPVDVTATSPSQLSAEVNASRADPRWVGQTVTVPDDLMAVGPAIGAGQGAPRVAALGPRHGATVTVLIVQDPPPVYGVDPQPPAPRFAPGASGTATIEADAVGKVETISADSLLPSPGAGDPARVGPATIEVRHPTPGMGLELGPPRPVRVSVQRVIRDRAIIGPGSPLDGTSAGDDVPIVVPDHHCRRSGFWPPVLLRDREWVASNQTVQFWQIGSPDALAWRMIGA